MKAGKEHRVPLCESVLRFLERPPNEIQRTTQPAFVTQVVGVSGGR